jgi:hypothetical protein
VVAILIEWDESAFALYQPFASSPIYQRLTASNNGAVAPFIVPNSISTTQSRPPGWSKPVYTDSNGQGQCFLRQPNCTIVNITIPRATAAASQECVPMQRDAPRELCATVTVVTVTVLSSHSPVLWVLSRFCRTPGARSCPSIGRIQSTQQQDGAYPVSFFWQAHNRPRAPTARSKASGFSVFTGNI